MGPANRLKPAPERSPWGGQRRSCGRHSAADPKRIFGPAGEPKWCRPIAGYATASNWIPERQHPTWQVRQFAVG